MAYSIYKVFQFLTLEHWLVQSSRARIVGQYNTIETYSTSLFNWLHQFQFLYTYFIFINGSQQQGLTQRSRVIITLINKSSLLSIYSLRRQLGHSCRRSTSLCLSAHKHYLLVSNNEWHFNIHTCMTECIGWLFLLFIHGNWIILHFRWRFVYRQTFHSMTGEKLKAQWNSVTWRAATLNCQGHSECYSKRVHGIIARWYFFNRAGSFILSFFDLFFGKLNYFAGNTVMGVNFSVIFCDGVVRVRAWVFFSEAGVWGGFYFNTAYRSRYHIIVKIRDQRHILISQYLGRRGRSIQSSKLACLQLTRCNEKLNNNRKTLAIKWDEEDNWVESLLNSLTYR